MSGFSPRHISIFIPTLTGGGVEKNMVNLSRGFVDKGHTVDMVLAKAVGPFLDELDPRVNLVDLKSSRVLVAIPGLVRYLRRRRPDILLAGMGHANVVALVARWLSRIPCKVVVSVHTVLSVHKKYSDKKLTGAIPLLARFLYPRAAGIIAVSDDVAADLVKISGLAPESITVIGNPVVTPELRAGYDQRPQHRFFGPNMPPVVLSVGRMDPQKAFDVLLDAHALLLKQVPHNLLILGDGRDRPQLAKQAADLGVNDTVDMPGFVEGVPGYMAQSAVFALASRFEGFGNVLVEALAGGLPVVATRCSGGPSFILADGRYGPLVPVQDPQALADAVAGVLADPPDSAELVERAEDFSLDSITDAYLDLFQKFFLESATCSEGRSRRPA
jgi:glycosyltransferase involved in cell wall biosynthesis